MLGKVHVASPNLIQQAIERTELEISDPIKTCGFTGWDSSTFNRMTGSMSRRLMADYLANTAEPRLAELKRLLKIQQQNG